MNRFVQKAAGELLRLISGWRASGTCALCFQPWATAIRLDVPEPAVWTALARIVHTQHLRAEIRLGEWVWLRAVEE